MLFNRKKKEEVIQEISEKSVVPSNGMLDLDTEISFLSGDIGKLEVEKKKTKEPAPIRRESLLGAFRNMIRKPAKPAVPDSAQKSIPYKTAYINGIIETKPKEYTKCYRLSDTNFRTARDDKQAEMFLSYGDFLNYFTPDVRAQILIWNSTIDKSEFKKNILFDKMDPKYDDLRQDMNEMLLRKMTEGQNSIVQEKYLIVSIKADNIEIACNTFGRIDSELESRIKVINDSHTEPMSLEERLELLYRILNQDSDTHFFERMEINGKEATTFNVEYMQQLGLTTKDMIAPEVISYKDSYFKLNEKFGRCLYLRNLPTQLTADVLSDIANLPCNALTSVHIKPILQDEAAKLVRNQMLEVTRNMSSVAKKNAGKGLGPEFLSPDLAQEKKESEKLYEDLTEGNQKAFLQTLVVTVFADDLDDLDKFTNIVRNNAAAKLCSLERLSMQQENGFVSCLPLGVNRIWADRLLNTVSAALFMPFESHELLEPGGIYYGLNGTSKNMIVYNRTTATNGNAIVLGIPGSGKGMSSKSEMTQAFYRSPKNEIFVIDPQGEYRPLCESLGGQVIEIEPDSKTYCNPFDLDLAADSNDNSDPVRAKSSYICSICETAIAGDEYKLNPIHVTIIDRCVRKIYEPYMAHMRKLRANGSTITCDTTASPTMVDFYKELRHQEEPEANYIAVALEKYATGSYDTFAHRTNVNTDNRFVVYDIKNIGPGMMELGMQVCLNDIWIRTVANHKRGVRTWIYVDEAYLLTQSESCSKHLMRISKQARKFGGLLTVISQNTEDFLLNREARALFNNCQFMLIHNLQDEDRAEIGKRLSISDAQLDYIRNADKGQGLIYTGRTIVPFINKIPRETLLYQTISTNPNEQTVFVS